jgi:hypothetical protein
MSDKAIKGEYLECPSGLNLSHEDWQALGALVAKRAMPLAYDGAWPPETWIDNGKDAMFIWYDAGEMKYAPVTGFEVIG